MLIFYLVGTVKMKTKLLEIPKMYYSKLRVEMRMKLKQMMTEVQSLLPTTSCRWFTSFQKERNENGNKVLLYLELL
jgi:hypothetical protein